MSGCSLAGLVFGAERALLEYENTRRVEENALRKQVRCSVTSDLLLLIITGSQRTCPPRRYSLGDRDREMADREGRRNVGFGRRCMRTLTVLRSLGVLQQGWIHLYIKCRFIITTADDDNFVLVQKLKSPICAGWCYEGRNALLKYDFYVVPQESSYAQLG